MRVIFLIFGDAVLLYAALLSGLFLRYRDGTLGESISIHLIPFSLIFVLWLMILAAFGLYDFRFVKNTKIFFERLGGGIFTAVVLSVVVFYAIPTGIEPKRNLLLIAVLSLVFLIAWRFSYNYLLGRTKGSKVLFFGITKETANLADYLLKNPQLGQRPVGFITEPGAKIEALPIPSFDVPASELYRIAKETDTEIIVISPEMKADREMVEALLKVIPLGVFIMEFPHFHEMITGRIPLYVIKEIWFLENLIGRARPRYEFLKRLLDIFLALALGIVFLALFPLIAGGIILSSLGDIAHYRERRARPGDGIIFFLQKRVGQNGKIFDFFKFRSQVLGSEKMGEAKELAIDPRKYPFGTLLRKTYLDELPQLWNVLRGEMSFIGPRPERPEYVGLLKPKVPFYEMRLLVAPGITGWAQINMENDASVEDAPEKMQYDLYYIKNRSLSLDLLIGLRTLFSIIGRTGR